jgi:toxin ParE1/3/4
MTDLSAQTPRRIEFSNRALSDLEEIWSHFSKSGEYVADKVLKQITEKVSKLLNSPKIGRKRNDLLIGLRSFPAGKFVIFYQETNFGIEIVRVVHSSRDIQQIFEDMIPLEP